MIDDDDDDDVLLLGNRIHHLVGVSLLISVIIIIIVVVVSLCIHRRLASDGHTTHDVSRDRMAAGHVTCEMDAKRTPATVSYTHLTLPTILRV